MIGHWVGWKGGRPDVIYMARSNVSKYVKVKCHAATLAER